MPIPPFRVPDSLPKERVIELAKVFKPIKIKDNKASLILPGADLFNHSFIWSPKLETYKGDLYTLDAFYSVHSYGAPSLFKPSIAEVIQQIPASYHKLKVCYFEVVGPDDCHDMNLWNEHTQKGLHVAKTTLYLPEPTLQTMSQYWHEHKDMLALTGNRPDNVPSAARWLHAMTPEDRLEAMSYFCTKCGTSRVDEKAIIDFDTPKDGHECKKCGFKFPLTGVN